MSYRIDFHAAKIHRKDKKRKKKAFFFFYLVFLHYFCNINND